MPGLKRRYGDRICMIGGIDRRILSETLDIIECEVREKVNLARQGRIVPCLSGQVLPEVPLSAYRHYAECLRRYIEDAGCVPNPDAT